MTIKKVREVLWAKFALIPDETLLALVGLIESVCNYVITAEHIQDNTEYIENEDHER